MSVLLPGQVSPDVDVIEFELYITDIVRTARSVTKLGNSSGFGRGLDAGSPFESIPGYRQFTSIDIGFATIACSLNGVAMNESSTTRNRQDRNELMITLREMVHRKMLSCGGYSPEIIMSGPEGLSKLAFPNGVGTGEFAEIARTACVARGAVAVALIAEVWLKRTKNPENYDLTAPPGQSADPKEAVMIKMETRSFWSQRMLPIERSTNGEFRGFGDALEDAENQCQGRFANLLTPLYPDVVDRGCAKAALALRGVTIEAVDDGRERSREQVEEERRELLGMWI